jgi:hypothetical protein
MQMMMLAGKTTRKCYALFRDGGGNTNDIQGGINLNKTAVFAYTIALVNKPLKPDIFQYLCG